MQDTEVLYQALIDMSQEGVWLIDAEARTTYVNRRMAEMLGYTVEEMLGRAMYDFMDAAARSEARRNFERRKGGVREQHDFRLRSKGGAELWTIMSTNPILGEGGEFRGALAMVTDITERKRAEEALRESEARFRAIFEETGSGNALSDIDGQILETNRAMQEMLGYSADELRSMRFTDFTHPDCVDGELRLLQELVAGERQSYQVEKCCLRKDGEAIWVRVIVSLIRDVEGRPLYACGAAENITERKRAEDQLRESEMQLAAAQQIAHLGSWDWDTVADNIVRSDELYRIYGLKPQELTSTYGAFLHLVHPDDRDHVQSAIHDALRERKRFSCEYRIIRPDGAVRTLHSQGEVICDEAGTPIRMIGVAQDITERRRAEINISAFSSLGQRLSSAITREEAARIIAEVADDLLGWDACSLDLYLPDQDKIRPVLTVDVINGRRCDVPPAYSDAAPSPLARQVIAEGGQLILQSGASGERDDLVPFGDITRPSASLMFVPVRNGKKVIGVLSVQSYAANFYNQDDLKTLQALADHCGGALERIQAERALLESEALFRLLVKSIKDYAILTLDEGGFVTSWNEGAERILGYCETEIIGQHASRFFTPEDIQRGAPEEELRMARTEGRADDERWQVRKDGTRFWADGVLTAMGNGHLRGFVKVMRDNTERKMLEEELRVREDRLNAFFTSTPAGLAILDADLRFVQINETLAQINGVSIEDHLEKTVREALPGLAPLVEPLLRKVLATGEPELRLELSGEPPGHPGLVRHVAASYFPLKAAAGKPNGVGALIVDQTERKRAEEQLKSSHEQLRALSAYLQSVREEESTRIAREIHDELGQLLTSLIIDLSWLEEKLAGAGDGALSGPLLEKVRSMVVLVDLTIDTVRRIAKELRPALLDDFGLAAAVEWHAGEFHKRTGIECKFVSNLRDADLTPDCSTALFRIFQEALTNIARHANASRVDITLEQGGENVVLEVRDDGRGISEGELSDIRSLGILGMRERARLLGGVVHISATPDGGTKLTVRVPLPCRR